MPRLIGRDGRNRLPMIVTVGLLAVSAIALVAFYLFPHSRSGNTEPTPEAGGVAPSPSVSLDAGDDPAPTGCLGGQDRTPGMVLAAQKAAPHTTFGAVEVAAALLRWSIQYPYPTPSDVRTVRPILAPSSAAKQQQDWLTDYSSRGYTAPPGVDVAAGTPFYLTTANGSWLTASSSATDEVRVQLEAHPVVDDAYRTSTVTLQVNLRWLDGSWHVESLGMADAQALANGGTSFTSGC